MEQLNVFYIVFFIILTQYQSNCQITFIKTIDGEKFRENTIPSKE
jgi:hypothetical protein